MAVDTIVRGWENDGSLLHLMAGSPGPESLKDCKEIILQATKYILVSLLSSTKLLVMFVFNWSALLDLLGIEATKHFPDCRSRESK